METVMAMGTAMVMAMATVTVMGMVKVTAMAATARIRGRVSQDGNSTRV